jgi:hypothetical protein
VAQSRRNDSDHGQPDVWSCLIEHQDFKASGRDNSNAVPNVLEEIVRRVALEILQPPRRQRGIG